jgi:endonuclease YncB( thermonuclease family)
MRRALPLAAALAWLLLASFPAAQPADILRGRVVSVADGDTVTVLDTAKVQHRIRLNGIDAPETRQPFAARSKSHLSDLVFGRDVTVLWSKADRDGRLVGTVTIGAVNTSLEQLRAGFAWYYRQYATDVAPANRPLYEAAETAARQARLGLWSEPNPQAPWLFRNPSAATPSTTPTSRGLLDSPAKAPASSIRIIGNRRSHIYHLPGCPNYGSVAERNRVYFTSEAEAQAAGYRKARNC